MQQLSVSRADNFTVESWNGARSIGLAADLPALSASVRLTHLAGHSRILLSVLITFSSFTHYTYTPSISASNL